MNKAKQIIEAINEIERAYYEVAYYEEVGQHGSAGSYPTFARALDAAKKVEVDEGTWYVGVEGSGNEFAVVHITQDYIDHTKSLGDNAFSTPEVGKKWMAVAQKALETGQPQTGKW
jgi:hypothetical protein